MQAPHRPSRKRKRETFNTTYKTLNSKIANIKKNTITYKLRNLESGHAASLAAVSLARVRKATSLCMDVVLGLGRENAIVLKGDGPAFGYPGHLKGPGRGGYKARL